MVVPSYRNLIAGQKARDFAAAVYRASEGFPREETSGLEARLRRSAISVPSNNAEGQGRETPRDFMRLQSIACGSWLEVETQLTLAARFGYIEQAPCEALLAQSAERGRIRNGLTRAPLRGESETNHRPLAIDHC
jgi:four helix bundle protein